jgi:aminoglycoside 6'-N-acetyltransferase I
MQLAIGNHLWSGTMNIFKATQKELDEWRSLALELWSDSSTADMQETLTAILDSPRQAGFLVSNEDGQAIAFMNLSLRHDYVPDATQSPVAFVEGIYVKNEYRHQGVGTVMIHHAEQWALEQGCIELASDALIENTASYEFHTKIGFREVERVVFFIKPLKATDPD